MIPEVGEGGGGEGREEGQKNCNLLLYTKCIHNMFSIANLVHAYYTGNSLKSGRVAQHF